MKFRNLVEVLRLRKRETDKGISFINGVDHHEFLSYNQLYNEAVKVLGRLQQKGMRPKGELVFQIEDNRTFIIVFWACILGGIIPVPLTIGQNDEHKQKLFNIWEFLKNPGLIISAQNFNKLKEYSQKKDITHFFKKMSVNYFDECDILDGEELGKICQPLENDIAFVQFSSGSTGAPKGVVLTHRNLIVNMQSIATAAKYSSSDSMLSWMPLTHDMGLIGFHLNPLFCGMNHYIMPPSLFVRVPAFWIDSASSYKASILSSPNFGYRYFIKHVNISVRHSWDLSNVRIIYNGAEPVSEKLCQEFVDLLLPYGLRKNSMCPVYGLAEASLAVSISEIEDEVIAINVDRNKLKLLDSVSICQESSKGVSFVNVGKPIEDDLLRITDNEGNVVDDKVVGNLRIKGPNVTGGYYNNKAETKKLFDKNGWLKTGDLGFIKDGALYITGRSKDIFFVNGQNFYPHDIERLAENVEGIELNKIAVTGFFNHQTQKEETVAFVFHRGSLDSFISLLQKLKLEIRRSLGLELDRILPIKDIPRTTSGKLQRFKLLEWYNNGSFKEVETQINALLKVQEKEDAHLRSEIKPGDETAKTLSKIWQKIFPDQTFSENTIFLEAGGNSLKAAQLAMAIASEFQVDLPLDFLYKKQTVADLVSEISTLHKLHKFNYAPIPIAEFDDYYPISSVQKRLYYFWASNKSSTAYNIPVAFEIGGEIHTNLLERCIIQLINMHTSLRTSFQLHEEPKFKVYDAVDFKLVQEECEEREIDEMLRSWIQPFNLEIGPLFRIKLLKTENDRFILFLDFHHIISDGISVANFLTELSDLYHGVAVPEVKLQYKDYVNWEAKKMYWPNMESQRVYWHSELEGELPLLSVPLDYERPVVFDTQGAKIQLALSADTSDKLKKLSKENGCSLHVLLFTLYSILLSKYTNQRDIIIGIPVSGRRHPDLRDTQGMFVNNLPIRIAIDGDESFLELLQSINIKITNALKNQDYPFDVLVQEKNVKRFAGRNPVFDTMFLFQNMDIAKNNYGDFKLRKYFFDPGFAKFDISLEVYDTEASFILEVEYATKLFKKETIVRLVGHFDYLIQSILDNPQKKLSNLSLITASEYQQYIKQFNETDRDYPWDKPIDVLFEKQVKRSPESVAIECNNENITYFELNDLANSLSHLLTDKSITSGSIVGILLPKSSELIISILGILKTGAAYLPIDIAWPEQRIMQIIADSKCSLVVTTTDHADRLSELTTQESRELILISIGLLRGNSRKSKAISKIKDPKNTAYVIYTSGTTGKPKGVMISHQSLVNYTIWAADNYVKGEACTFALFSSISFDLTVTSIFVPLLTGNKIVVYEEDGNSILIERVIKDRRADVIKLTPSHLKILAESNWLSAETKVKRFIVGGEQLDRQLAEKIHKKLNGRAEILNEYGPTEATVGCMIYKFDPEDPGASVPIGVPASNTQIYILDKFLNPVPPGVHGELFISGDGIATGYLFEKNLTESKFPNNPFVPHRTMYRTGDVAKFLSNTIIEYIGRFDQQVKINGYRIELTEISNHLLDYPGLTNAVVILRANEKNQEVLSAFYVSRQEIPDTLLKNHMAKRLPYYMIPVHFVKVDEIPLTGNGKVDYSALSKLVINNVKEEIQPRNNVEAISLQVWKQIFNAPDLGITTNFYELGGDSIKAVQIASKLIEYGIMIEVKDILTYHTIEQISLHASNVIVDTSRDQGTIEGEKQLTPIEAWFFDQNFINPSYYNQSVVLRVKRMPEISILNEVFKNLIRQHDGLRLNFDELRHTLFYNPRHLRENFIVEKYEIDPRDKMGFVDICQEIKKSFDFTKDLLIKAALIQQGDNIALFITAHHLVIDGFSWRIFLNDFQLLYNSLLRGEQLTPMRRTVTLSDWQRKLIDLSKSAAFKFEETYWEEIEKIDFSIPCDFETDEWHVGNLNSVSSKLTKDATDYLLKKGPQVYNVDASVLLTTALAMTLREWTGQNTLVIEIENHGRYLEDVDSSRTVGWFTTIYPQKLELKTETVGEKIRMVKEQLRSVPNHGMGYGVCKYFLGLQNLSKKQLAEVRFNYLGQFDDELDNDLFSYVHGVHGFDSDPFNKITARLDINIMIVDGVLRMDISFNNKAHKESTIHWLRDLFFNNLEMIFEHISQLKSVPFTPAEFDFAALNEEDLKALFD